MNAEHPQKDELATLTPEQFLERSDEMLITLTASMIEGISQTNPFITENVATEGFETYVETERRFMRAVLDGFERWSHDSNNVVLWDVDDTLGKAVNRREERTWYLRPAMQLLIPYLNRHYPEMKNGFLTSRGKDFIAMDFEMFPELMQEYPLFDFDLAYSTRDFYMSTTNISALCTEFQSISNRTNQDFALKYSILQKLRAEHSDIHYRVIDDNVVAELAGEDGVDVYQMMPKTY